MNNAAEKILYRKAALIFEELGFLMPRSENSEMASSDSISAMVTFKGPFSGCLLVSLSPQMLSLLSSNMLGEEGRSNKLLEQDSLREIANVICGNALPAIYGFESVFHLDAPALLDDPDSVLSNSDYRKEAQVHISFDSGRAAVSILVDKRAPAAASN
jgi:CheY-specific phosphatase CheX